MNRPHSVGEILDSLDELAAQRKRVSLGAIVESFGNRSYGPVLIVPMLLDWTPLSGFPGVESFLALTAAIVAAQMMVGRKHLWLPGFIARRSLASPKLRRAAARMRGVARFMDRHFHDRLERLTHAPFSRIAAALVIVICLTVPPLDLVPFGGSGAMIAIAVFGLAILVRDGVLMFVALALGAGAMVLSLLLWSGVAGG
jgi:hypothetical protein